MTDTLLAVEERTQGTGPSIAANLPTGATSFWRLVLTLPTTK